ncbi:hypothetical protein A2U01_0044061 [Trifolium medium]|uniref:Uncharacterized protein n=1 Tax=Trifolium medium TaxID=97028 RepID=A0A392QET7_9FABA|nr:hypothetical protein [Trifolium medium]
MGIWQKTHAVVKAKRKLTRVSSSPSLSSSLPSSLTLAGATPAASRSNGSGGLLWSEFFSDGVDSFFLRF